jgi:hypothetical protein
MSQRDVAAELRTARVHAPNELRERIRLIGAATTTTRPPRRRITWRRAAVVLVPVAAAVAAVVVIATRPSPQRVTHGQALLAHGALAPRAATVPSSPTRVQRYAASLTLRVPAVSDAVKRALHIAASFGGFPVSVHVASTANAGTADLVLKVPRANVQEAVAQLSQLGTITSEQVAVQDLQQGINATDRTIARLQQQLAQLRAVPQTEAVKRQIAALTQQVEALQRARAATIRAAHFATIDLALTTRPPAPPQHHHGPLHGLAVAFRWLGVGLVYTLALGLPLLALAAVVWLVVRTIRRRREDALLSER